MYQYLLFDLDGTLTDPKIGITSCVQHALKAFDIHVDNLDELEPFIGPPLKDSFMEFYGLTPDEAMHAIDVYHERFDDIGIYENEIYPGIPELLAHVKKVGCRIAIASSKPTYLVKRVLEYFHIDQYFDEVVGSEPYGVRGSKEEVVEEALRRLVPEELLLASSDTNRRKEMIAMIGDRKFDIQGAIAHGLTGIGVSYGYAPEGELKEAGADIIADTVAELERMIL